MTKLVRFSSLIGFLLLAFTIQVNAQKKLTTGEAKEHFGETATVCGEVVSTRYAASTKGQPTFLNLDKPYPSQAFTVVIWGSNRSKFGAPESDYKDKRVCVTGKITEYRGLPELVADEPKQIKNRHSKVVAQELSQCCPKTGAMRNARSARAIARQIAIPNSRDDRAG